MRSSPGPVLIRTALALACVALGPRPSAAPNPDLAASAAKMLHISGRSLDAKGVYAGPVDIYLERWSTDEEWQNVSKAMMVKPDPEALLTALEKVRVRVGYVLTPGIQASGERARLRRAWNIEAARDFKTPTGRRIVIASQDHLPIGEFPRDVAANGAPHRADVLEFRFDKDGKGVGKLADGAKISFDKSIKTIEIAKYDSEPVRLADAVAAPVKKRTVPPKEYYGAKATTAPR
ncbi:MAG TPA: hypothetical protein VKD69_04280 [Vicinamibacterales bacterium]|nr:hypothetical protein [Vicinamibacterales bacterium]